MNEFVTAISTGITAFSATNIDNLILLMLFFAQLSATFRRRHIFIGLYLGFIAMIVASIPGFFGGLILPERWIALLGFVPIALGLSRLLKPESDSSQIEEEIEQSDNSSTASFFSNQTYTVAAVMFANGSDNIGVYIPLFANNDLKNLSIILAVFFLLLGLGYYVADQLTRQPSVAEILIHYGNAIVPFVLIGLGVYILWENVTFTLVSLVVSFFYWMLMLLIRNIRQAPSV